MNKELKKGHSLIKKLGLMPPNILTPSKLADYFDLSIDAHPLAYAGIHAVGAGEGYLGFTQTGTRGGTLKIAVVGKGITFDSGGVSIKPSNNMSDMKFDMLGCATVLALKDLLKDSKHDIALYGCIAENMFQGNIMRPGDVITYRDGTKVEIDNTDAEGRLVLADGILEAKRGGTHLIITIATLTGAAKAALGEATAIFGNDPARIADILQSLARTQELGWPMPIYDHHRKAIKGPKGVADIKNCANVAGASTAAAFLEHFVGDTPWLHFDIAGSAYKNHKPTGAMLETLVDFITNLV